MRSTVTSVAFVALAEAVFSLDLRVERLLATTFIFDAFLADQSRAVADHSLLSGVVDCSKFKSVNVCNGYYPILITFHYNFNALRRPIAQFKRIDVRRVIFFRWNKNNYINIYQMSDTSSSMSTY